MRRTIWVLAGAVAVLATACYQDLDFTGDHKADHVLIDGNGTWTDQATGAVIRTGTVGDWPAPGDYDGDHLADAAVVHPNGDWDTNGAVPTFSFPEPAELPAFVGVPSFSMLPVPADYDGDGSVDAAWYRESDATWFIRGQAPIQFGSGPTVAPGVPATVDQQRNYDFPVPADYDGDGTDDLSTFNPRTQLWAVRSSVDDTVSTVAMPGNELLPMPVPADYDGVGHAQRAVFGPYGWTIEGHAGLDPFGASTPTNPSGGFPAVADHDGDNRADLSYVNFDTSTWQTKGTAQTYPVPGFTNGTNWPVATGYNLRVNIARLTQLGRCNADPQRC